MTLPAHRKFQSQARTWLASVADPVGVDDGLTSQPEAIFDSWTAEEEREITAAGRAYEARKHDAGWGALTWSATYGGRELPFAYELLFRAVEAEFALPRRTEIFPVTQQLVAPTIEQWGTEDQRSRYVVPLLRTDLLACQLFSEPGAGSDLAAVRTTARRDGADWLLHGQKVWTSGARVADYGVALCRTDTEVAKHAGLTMFLVPLAATGVDIRPIRQMTGGQSFNEVFLDGVRLTDDHRLGPVGAGWKVALTVLAAERLDSGSLGLENADHAIALALKLRSQAPEGAAAAFEQETADLIAQSYLQRLVGMQVAAAVVAGSDPGPEASLGKLLATDTMRRTSRLTRAALGARLRSDADPDAWRWREHLLGAPGYRIAGGTDEIQHNIIAERVLGLPKESRR